MGNPVVKNYIDPISGELVIGGEIQINGTMTVGEDATLTGMTPEALNAAGASLGGVKAAAKAVTDTVEAKIGEDAKLYVPAYPEDYVLPAAAADALGGVKLAENQADSEAAEVADLVDDFNALLAKLKAAGLMTDDA